MNARRALPGALVLLALVGGATWYFLPAPAPAKKTAAPAVPVKLAVATARDLTLKLDVMGRTAAYETVTLKARVDGQVRKVLFAEGQAVDAGQALIQLDPADYQAKLQQASANLAKSRVQLDKARIDLERTIALRAKGFVSEEKVGDMRTLVAAAQAGVDADNAAVDFAKLQLSYTAIAAPLAGRVGERQVYPGSMVKANDTPLTMIHRLRPLDIGFAIAEKHLAQLQTQDKIHARISLPGRSDGPLAEVRFINPSLDPATGTVELKARIDNRDEALRPGQFVAVSLALTTLKNATTIPVEAVQQGAAGSFVYVVKNDSASVRPVQIQAMQDGLAAIADGLQVGETAVTEGQLRLNAGAKVKEIAGRKPK